MGMNVRAVERRDRHPFLAPFVRADQSLQFAQRNHGRLTAGLAPGFGTGHADVWRTAQRDAVAAIERDQQQAERACALRLRHAMLVKGLGDAGGLLWPLFGAPAERLQQLPCVLEIAAIEQGGAFAGQFPGFVGACLVVHDSNTLRWRDSGLGAPACRLRLSVLLPVQHRQIAHCFAFRDGGLRACTAATSASCAQGRMPAGVSIASSGTVQ